MSYQPESRTRENRTSGSEGGVVQSNAPSLPLSARHRQLIHYGAWFPRCKLQAALNASTMRSVDRK